MRLTSTKVLDFSLLAGGLSAMSAGLMLSRPTLTAVAAVTLLAVVLRAARWMVRHRRQLGARGVVREEHVSTPERRRPLAERDWQTSDLVEEMMWLGRFALLLRPQIHQTLSEEQRQRALAELEEKMSLTPAGEVFLSAASLPDSERGRSAEKGEIVSVDAVFIDRHAVTNREYQKFVTAGGYEQMALWEAHVWPAVLDFVDTTGRSGPRYWKNAEYLPGTEEFPVVGISWFEAAAFARWAGKRLPSDAEWVKAGSWPVSVGGGIPQQRRFPWGDSFDARRANLWSEPSKGVVAVDAFPEGASVGGIYQLVGNVWEWMSSSYARWSAHPENLTEAGHLKSLRGGSFQTYFDSQASCQFQSGDSPLARRDNIGFRCALSWCDVSFTATVESPGVETRESTGVADSQEASEVEA